jgi:hypothetical protein
MIRYFTTAVLFGCTLLFSCRRSVENNVMETEKLAPLSSTLGTYDKTEASDSLMPKPVRNYIFGYTDKSSYYPGDSVQIFLSSDSANNGTVRLLDVNNVELQRLYAKIPRQTISNSKPWLNGLGFNKTLSAFIKPGFKSGFYTWNGNIGFVIKKPALAESQITVVYPSNTANAYCYDGGKSLYKPTVNDRSYVVSFHRYQPLEQYSINFLKWIQGQNYDINYIADQDMDDYNNIANSKLVIIIGHSEYWTKKARKNLDLFVESGKNALVLSGNTMWWQVRYNDQKNLMICYKSKTIDPMSNTEFATFNWPDRSLKYPTYSSIGVDFVNGGFADKLPARWDGYKIVKENSPLLLGTGLRKGDILKNPSYECDGAPLLNVVLPGSTAIPIINNAFLKFNKVELIGYNFTLNTGNVPGVATFIVGRKKPTSGVIVNTASDGWCKSITSDLADKVRIQTITKNMINRTLANQSLFTP